MDEDGKLLLDLNRTGLNDLAPLAGMPFKKLLLGDNDFTDLTPLAGIPMEHLNLGGTANVKDLRPLKSNPLRPPTQPIT